MNESKFLNNLLNLYFTLHGGKKNFLKNIGLLEEENNVDTVLKPEGIPLNEEEYLLNKIKTTPPEKFLLPKKRKKIATFSLIIKKIFLNKNV